MTRGVAVARRRRQAAWWRGELGGVAVSLLCLLAEVGDDWHTPVGWAMLGQVSGRQVSPGKFLFFYFCSVLFC